MNQAIAGWPWGTTSTAASSGPIAEPVLPPTWKVDCAVPKRPRVQPRSSEQVVALHVLLEAGEVLGHGLEGVNLPLRAHAFGEQQGVKTYVCSGVDDRVAFVDQRKKQLRSDRLIGAEKIDLALHVVSEIAFHAQTIIELSGPPALRESLADALEPLIQPSAGYSRFSP